jgi:hypothetical protein
LKHLRRDGLSIALAALESTIAERLKKSCSEQNIGLLSVYPPKARWLVPLPEEKNTREVLRLKRAIHQSKLNLLAEKMGIWPIQGPICPEHKIPSEPTTFEDRIQMRGWKCKYGDFEILHPLDAELSLYLNKFGPIRVRAANVGGQIVLRLPKLAAARYGIQEGREYELDIVNLNTIGVKKSAVP